ncbi:transferrin receptor 1b [Paramormyrops kingsleyae]|uniref:Transferrin receptor protein 1 n=1 Tax=Paramormyrops kingsleyae TaxID=1676925 RepID=A0A3B3SWD9_9TELE|nr:transferrin receptor protein 1 [Paramormyrops kingsleyae]XP_023674312.1 transferrin receptor protein 1 [Paramormyrops kingsleyae]XP_023674313.1 transferrin receptor protein 1 [Paramormyrops kingsleyae]
MDQARSTISKIFNGEPRSYTRFNLTQNMEGENSQVEMKLSSDIDEETGNSVGDHFSQNHNQNQNGTWSQKHIQEMYLCNARRTPRNLCFMVTTTLLIFIIGYLIGYLAHNKQDKQAPNCPEHIVSDKQDEETRVYSEPELDWDGIKELLKQKLSPNRFDSVFKEFSKESHEAGSDNDRALALQIKARFQQYRMKPWTDDHFVKLQNLPASGTNKITIGEKKLEPRGYAAYSANGVRQGRLVYAHFGKENDFILLKQMGVNLTGSVALVRAGKLSFAEKVANAAKHQVVAILIYPDPAEYSLQPNTELYGHVHLGSGDPYTPGFPSFNHTQFPPVQSSGLPSILAQTISANAAAQLFRNMNGKNSPPNWDEGRLMGVTYNLGGDNDTVTVEVNNSLVEKMIHNVFGIIKGFVDPDRYVVIGAQRDSWGPGFTKATVGTSIMMELARAISEMVANNGFKPRRSIIFASWTAGEYGNVGATEWLEGYLTTLNLKAVSYINLDGIIRGKKTFQASGSPLLQSLLANTLKEMKSLIQSSDLSNVDFQTENLKPMKVDDAAYPFVAFSGIPSISLFFTDDRNGDIDYQYFGTVEDTREKLDSITFRTSQMAEIAAQIAGNMALRLVHDRLLSLDISKYNSQIRAFVIQINRLLWQQQKSGNIPKTLTSQWLISAAGSFSRASHNLISDIQNSDLEDVEMCRIINDRIMRVEHNLLSPYVSPKDTPFRHIVLGSGSHTLSDLVDHLKKLNQGPQYFDGDWFRNQFALATWTIQGCANALSGEVWEKDNQI